MESQHLATRAVELVGTYLTTAVARIPGGPAEQLYSLLATYLSKSPAGSVIFTDLRNAPNDQEARRMAAAKLVGLVERDQQFAAALTRAVRDAMGPPRVTRNEVRGDVSGGVVQAGAINDSTIDQSRHTDNSRRTTRVSFGGVVLIIVLVLGLGVAATVVVTNVFGGNTTGDCGRAERPVLTLSPTQGPADTEITVSGVGFIANGYVDIMFHANEMGEAPTDCRGAFSVTLPIPQSYRNVRDHSFDVHATEYTASGQYRGNGDFNGAQFQLTG